MLDGSHFLGVKSLMTELNFNNIHKFVFDNLHILLDINTDSLHVIDEITWDYLDALEKSAGNWEEAKKMVVSCYPKEELDHVQNEIENLITKGQLFTPEIEIANYQSPANPIIKAMCLHVAHDCNLRCRYCFADQGPYGGDRSLMSEDIGIQAFEFLFEASKNRCNLNVDFFGGEPLMNFEVVKKLVSYAEKRAAELGKIIEFTMTTNCVLLREDVQEFLKEHDISTVLSVDGRKSTHDNIRIFPNGSGSYDYVMKNILHFVRELEFKNYIIRGTYTRHNKDFVEDVKHLKELGFHMISLEPVVGDPDADYVFREEDLPFLKKQYEELTRYYWKCYEEGHGFEFFHFNIDLFKGPCLPKRISACGAGHEYVAVSPQGDLYPCHQFVGRDEFKIGHVSAGVLKPEVGQEFQNSHVLNKPECRKCWARFYCSGGCHASNLASTGSLLKPYKLGCELQRKRMECAIYLQVKKILAKN